MFYNVYVEKLFTDCDPIEEYTEKENNCIREMAMVMKYLLQHIINTICVSEK